MPLRDDLIQRTVQQIVEVLSWLLGNRDETRFDEAMQLIEAGYREQVGSGRALMLRLPSEELVRILSSAGGFDREKGYLLATLLDAEAQLLELRRRPVPPGMRLRALDLYLEAELAGLAETRARERIVELQHVLAEAALPETTLWRLFDYRVELGGYAGAEDLLFEALDRFGPSDRLAARGRAFYRELDGVSDAQLTAGGLPRAELAEGRRALEGALGRR